LQEHTSHKEQLLGTEGKTGDPISGEMENEERNSGEQDTQLGQDESAAPSQDQPMTSQSDKQQTNENEGVTKPQDANPRRSVGDAAKEWLKRLQSLRDPTNPEPRPETRKENAEMEQGMDFEFIQNDQEAHDAQVMDSATQEQMNQMEFDQNAAMMDQEEKDEHRAAAPEEEQELIPPEQPLSSAQVESIAHKDDEALETEQETLEAKAGQEPSHRMDADVQDVEIPCEEALDESVSELEDPIELDYDDLRQQLELNTSRLRESDKAVVAKDIWRNCCNLTRELSFDLCEQLRLILEPTLATKLKGDYRTGKRLNMRKVIPYIASQFKKDKIWMRRTKPSKRTYQIMLCIDDSKSMFDSGSVPLAYESLALISKALTQLEAGDISIVSFGNDVNLVHPFDKPFSDEAGVDAVKHFSFDQNGTHVQRMMESCSKILEHARSTQSALGSESLWQLQIIISDGLCQDHARIRSLVRKAAEQRVMVVFIILDKRSSNDSIMKMTSVTYDTDTKTGRPTLKMTKYMDTFPFDYFLPVSQIESLPQVLAETLRQYFTLVGNL
jgi:midasin (ATPase involved in ribosome maturation)